jgi:Glycosyl transferase family 2
VVPVWNRARVIRRCLDSVFSQVFQDYEVIAVDDGSVDGSYEVLTSFRHPRLRTFRREENGGTWAARAVGVHRSHGAWILFLDSDDALEPGALGCFSDWARATSPQVGVLGASYRDSEGHRRPEPPPPAGPMGMEEALAWMNAMVRSDFLAAYRREVFRTVALPAGFATGALFELEVFEHWQKQIYPDVCGIVYLDAPNRQTGRGASFSAESFLRRAQAWADVDEEILSRYGALLKRRAPRRFLLTKGRVGLYSLAAGRRLRGTAHLLEYLCRRPLSPGLWAFLIAGLVGPRALARARRTLG